MPKIQVAGRSNSKKSFSKKKPSSKRVVIKVKSGKKL